MQCHNTANATKRVIPTTMENVVIIFDFFFRGAFFLRSVSHQHVQFGMGESPYFGLRETANTVPQAQVIPLQWGGCSAAWQIHLQPRGENPSQKLQVSKLHPDALFPRPHLHVACTICSVLLPGSPVLIFDRYETRRYPRVHQVHF